MVHTFQNLKTLNLTLDLEFHQHLGSLKHVVNIIMWIRDTGCYTQTLVHFKRRRRGASERGAGRGQGASCIRVVFAVWCVFLNLFSFFSFFLYNIYVSINFYLPHFAFLHIIFISHPISLSLEMNNYTRAQKNDKSFFNYYFIKH
jgi:hypothetical protein